MFPNKPNTDTPNIRHTTQGVIPEGIIAYQEKHGLGDADLENVAMSPEVRREFEARISLGEQPALSTAWLDRLVNKAPIYHEPAATERQSGAEVKQYDNTLNAQTVATIAARLPDIRAIAIVNGQPSFRRDDYIEAA